MDQDGASCSTNSASAFQGLMKHTQRDRSLHHEARVSQSGPLGLTGARSAFRSPEAQATLPRLGKGKQPMHPSQDPFLLTDLNKALDHATVPSGWADDFMAHPHHPPPHGDSGFHEMETAFHQARHPPPSHLQEHRPQLSGWADDFHQSIQSPAPPPLHHASHTDFEEAFAVAEARTRNQPWEEQFTGVPSLSAQGIEGSAAEDFASEFTRVESDWASSFVASQEDQLSEEKEGARDALAVTAGALANAMEAQDDPRFARSQFAMLMRQFRDGTSVIEGNKVVDVITPANATSHAQEGPKDWLREFAQAKGAEEAEWAAEFSDASPAQAREVGEGWMDDFSRHISPQHHLHHQQQSPQHQPYSHPAGADHVAHLHTEMDSAWPAHETAPLSSVQESLADRGVDTRGASAPQQSASTSTYASNMDEWTRMFTANTAHLAVDPADEEWQRLDKQWTRESVQPGLGYAADADKSKDPYAYYAFFEGDNPYLVDPTHDTASRLLPLPSTAQEQRLELEARILRARAAGHIDDSLVESWTRLALLAQDKDNDPQAISALREAIHIGYQDAPFLQRTFLSLASSYVNENCRQEAYDALLSALPYTSSAGSPRSAQEGIGSRHEDVVHRYINAIQSSAGQDGAHIDPALQEGLALAFTISGEYAKAADCLSAALSVRPEDHVLWNRLGATLNNAGATEDAIHAFDRALSIRPGYPRAEENRRMALQARQ